MHQYQYFWSILRRICKISAVLDKNHDTIFRKSSKLSPSSCRPPACSPSPSSPQMSSVGGKHSDQHDYNYQEFQSSKRIGSTLSQRMFYYTLPVCLYKQIQGCIVRPVCWHQYPHLVLENCEEEVSLLGFGTTIITSI